MARTFIFKNGGFVNTGLYTHYNKWATSNRIAKKSRVDRVLLQKIVMAIMKEISKQIVESKGGVFIRNFGYFFIWKTQAVTTYGKTYGNNTVRYNHHTDNRLYLPIFISTGGPSNLRNWSMDYKFSVPIKEGVNKKLRSGFKYRTYMHTLKNTLNL